jgi:hypothetical protein
MGGQPAVLGGPAHDQSGPPAMHGPSAHCEQMQMVLPYAQATPPSAQAVPESGAIDPQAVDMTQALLVVVQAPPVHTHSSRHSGRASVP